MQVGQRWYRSIEGVDDGRSVRIVDQRRLPHHFEMAALTTVEEAFAAIREMWVRGAPLIGVTAAFGLAMAMNEDPSDDGVDRALQYLASSRPTAVNLFWALERVARRVRTHPPDARAEAAYRCAREMAEEDVERNRAIGDHGLPLLRELSERVGGRPLNVLTHCNAGWLATVDWGTATAPIYRAHAEGIPLHVWVSETRPRLQGAALTAWEMSGQGIDHTVVVDGAGASLMRGGEVDVVLVGTDRTTRSGDVANKIGTYGKALAAADNGVPFYVAVPSPSIDWSVADGDAEIPIEERSASEVTWVTGVDEGGAVREVRIVPEATHARNPAFDVTPADRVTGLITERGIAEASEEGLRRLFPDGSSDGS